MKNKGLIVKGISFAAIKIMENYKLTLSNNGKIDKHYVFQILNFLIPHIL